MLFITDMDSSKAKTETVEDEKEGFCKIQSAGNRQSSERF